MKKILLVSLVLVSALILFAEDKGKITEIGLTTTRPLYSYYNFTMKFGNENSVFRINSLSAGEYIKSENETRISENDTLSIVNYDLNGSFAFAVGREVRREIDHNFEFRYGMDITFGYTSRIDNRDYDTSYTHRNNIKTWSPGLQLVLGFNYVLKDRIVFGVEFLPKLYYSYTKYYYERTYTDPDYEDYNRTEYTYSWRFDLSTLALFSISYRF